LSGDPKESKTRDDDIDMYGTFERVELSKSQSPGLKGRQSRDLAGGSWRKTDIDNFCLGED
jgi:hypothetical protein